MIKNNCFDILNNILECIYEDSMVCFEGNSKKSTSSYIAAFSKNNNRSGRWMCIYKDTIWQ